MARAAQHLLYAVLVGSLLAGCATPAARCTVGDARVHELLYFGVQRPGGIVSPDEWADFLRATVTPKFPDGLTVWSASGQWRSGDGSLVREDSYVLNLVHADDIASEAAVRAIVAAYKSRFAQEAVMRVRTGACVSF
jgi:hypothetical protein